MPVSVAKFGEVNGKEVNSYILDNNNGLCAEIISYGGIIKKLVYKGVDVVLGRDTMEEYLDNTGCFSALIGRNSNRIANSEFELNGKTYKLYANDGKNNLHGGKIGFDKKVWDAEVIDSEEPALVLSLMSPDGDEGFPGNLQVKVTYTVTKDNGLEIKYYAVCDADTVINMTNHAYFNLNGHASGSTKNHSLWLGSSFYTPNNDECIPTGEILSVKGTPFDFTTEDTLADRYESDFEQITMFDGFDHNFALDGRGFRKIGEFKGDKSGIKMEIHTDQDGMQIYAGNKIEEGRVCKDGAVYGKHDGVCFETQAFPNNLNYSHFPTTIVKKGEEYKTVTTYKFI